MSDNIKIQLISAGNTFLATFFGTLGTALFATHTLQFSGAFWLGLIIVATRAAVKAVVSGFVPVALGGRKV